MIYLMVPDLFEMKRGPMRVVRDGGGVDARRFQRTIERILSGEQRQAVQPIGPRRPPGTRGRPPTSQAHS